MGRSFHFIAVASRENNFRIHQIHRREDGTLSIGAKEIIMSPDGSDIWRLAWNATGTVLVTSTQAGKVSLWRKAFSGRWEVTEEIGDATQPTLLQLHS
jgi:hypothetical protein